MKSKNELLDKLNLIEQTFRVRLMQNLFFMHFDGIQWEELEARTTDSAGQPLNGFPKYKPFLNVRKLMNDVKQKTDYKKLSASVYMSPSRELILDSWSAVEEYCQESKQFEKFEDESKQGTLAFMSLMRNASVHNKHISLRRQNGKDLVCIQDGRTVQFERPILVQNDPSEGWVETGKRLRHELKKDNHGDKIPSDFLILEGQNLFKHLRQWVQLELI